MIMDILSNTILLFTYDVELIGFGYILQTMNQKNTIIGIGLYNRDLESRRIMSQIQLTWV